jgi:hypothetical protein
MLEMIFKFLIELYLQTNITLQEGGLQAQNSFAPNFVSGTQFGR